ncbi:ubiquinol-cytochrome c reductase iron-sulfur subunit [Pseudonocardia sp. GCM10023141]|uniref:QcrA and Rieske domain-containing protein n=1 Tax=Pseudonocardia sp. GCM10023141 TaxID=3252653 RepID=UPI0036123A62
MNHPDTVPVALTRRAVVVAGGAAVLGAGVLAAGCSAQPARVAAGPGTALGPATDVPVGSAKIFDDQGVVVTQAAAGTYAGFSTVCPHQGCSVSKVTAGRIVCPCHGSTFALDGSVVQGPAPTGLTAMGVTVTGGQITLT